MMVMVIMVIMVIMVVVVVVVVLVVVVVVVVVVVSAKLFIRLRFGGPLRPEGSESARYTAGIKAWGHLNTIQQSK